MDIRAGYGRCLRVGPAPRVTVVEVTAARELLVYTTATCGHCWSLKRWLTGEQIAFREIEISDDPAAQQLVRTVAGGYMSVPTVVFPDGTVLIEPSPAQVRASLSA